MATTTQIIEAWREGRLTDGEAAAMILANRTARLKDRRERRRDLVIGTHNEPVVDAWGRVTWQPAQ